MRLANIGEQYLRLSEPINTSTPSGNTSEATKLTFINDPKDLIVRPPALKIVSKALSIFEDTYTVPSLVLPILVIISSATAITGVLPIDLIIVEYTALCKSGCSNTHCAVSALSLLGKSLAAIAGDIPSVIKAL